MKLDQPKRTQEYKKKVRRSAVSPLCMYVYYKPPSYQLPPIP